MKRKVSVHSLNHPLFSEKNTAKRRKQVLALPRRKSPDNFALFALIIKNDPSPVIRHEVAFILGTMKSPQSLDILINAIQNDDSDLVRHEAIEALGDIGMKGKKVEKLLKSLRKDPILFIRDTAEIALETLKI